MQAEVDDYLTPRHRTLKLIATASGILAYVALAFFAIQAASTAALAIFQARANPIDIMLARQAPVLQFANIALVALNRLLSGVVFWVLLTGLSLGLRMLVETDLNYRLRADEVDDE